ncbi:MAG: TraB/GumN family protein [Sphingomonadales bacterium]|nr:TraB/GumN family protein [Sphingomonadales bacterium]
MFNRLLLILGALLALAGCARPVEVRPALWLVEGAGGQRAWLFGTIHALPAPVAWRSAKVDAALQQADRLVLEVADIANDAATAKAFAALARSPGLPPLDQRVAADLRDDLAADLKAGGVSPGELDGYETWAAALMLQQALSGSDPSDAANGIDRALSREWSGPVQEFEGASAQLAIFDRLPEAQQRALLIAVVRDGDDHGQRLRELEKAWARGDLDLIARVTDQDLGSEPALRDALLVRRNHDWLRQLEALLRSGARPFVAVGTAHLAGTDGLPALLAQRGWKITRLQ